MLPGSVIQKILSGMNYDEYMSHSVSELAKQEQQTSRHNLLKLNIQRSRRIDKTFLPDDETSNLIASIDNKQVWLILTEPWCGDSAQNVPYIVKLAALNPLVDVRLLLRDSNPGVMDMYLTNGARSIPKLIAFDREWNELFRWGSRPQPAAELVRKLKEDGLEKSGVERELHTWYALNNGKSAVAEICEALRREIPADYL